MLMIITHLVAFIFPLISCRSFTIDYKNNCFLKDGEPFRYVAGSLHYFRIPCQYWEDRIYKMKMAGLNAIDTYVEWNHHEPEPGVYNFKDRYNLLKFLQTAQDLDMLVVLRPGPFIDSERDMGGLPYWLLRVDPNMKLRTYNDKYIHYVDQWFSVLLPLIEPYLYNNGGPIISIQVENEYGSIGICNAQYMTHLRDLFREYFNNNVVLFTTDGGTPEMLRCGKTDEVFLTVDFGPGDDVSKMFDLLRRYQLSGPLVNSEYYPGWLDHWGQPHANVNSKTVAKTLTEMLQHNASVNVYVFHGGTSFGFSPGSNYGYKFQAGTTSYDYDAPLSEAGDPTPKYYEMRDAIGKFLPLPPGPVPEPAPKMELTPITMNKLVSLWDYISLSELRVITSKHPLSFEDLYQPYGFVVYQATVNFRASDPSLLSVPDLADRGYVYVNKVLQGILSREQKIFSLPMKIQKGEDIVILVENQGRINRRIIDRKGIFRKVTLGSKELLNWRMTPITFDNIENLDKLVIEQSNESSMGPAIYCGKFVIEQTQILDTFLRVDGWHKGVASLNNINLGRYWPIVGPQVTMYAPGVFFKRYPEVNTIVLFELEQSPCSNKDNCFVKFVKTHIVNGATPEN